MESKQELEQWLARLEARWAKGAFCSPQEIVKMDRKMKELKKKIVQMESHVKKL